MGHSKAELSPNQAELASSKDQGPVSRIPRLFAWQLMELETIITKREKNAGLKEPPHWEEAATSVINFLSISLKGAEPLEEKDGKIGCDLDATSAWSKVINLTYELKTAQKAGLDLQIPDAKRTLVQSWLYYLHGLINPKESLQLKPHVSETLLEFLKTAQSELLKRAQYELAR